MAFPIIMGQNIGTCITPILASIGASKNAKRTAAVHVSFNVLGTIIFVIGCYTFQHFVGFSFWDAPIDKGGIANFHTIFNVTVTLLFIPLVGLLEKIARTLVRDKPGDRDQEITAITLDERLLVSPGLAVEHAREAVVQMANIARQNYLSAIGLLFQYDPKVVERINENEDVVDKLEDRVETYLLRLGERELSDSENRSISELLHTCGEFERVADHAENICECADRMFETKTKFSKKATEEMQTICEAVKEILDLRSTPSRMWTAGRRRASRRSKRSWTRWSSSSRISTSTACGAASARWTRRSPMWRRSRTSSGSRTSVPTWASRCSPTTAGWRRSTATSTNDCTATSTTAATRRSTRPLRRSTTAA